MLTFGSDATSTVRIVFETPLPCITTIYYGIDEKLNETPITESNAKTIHKFILTNLTPNTKYYYLINSTSINYNFMNKLFTFRTAPQPADDKPFKFVVIGDTRPDIWGITQHSNLINKILEREPDFIFNVGDIVMGPKYSEQWDRFFYEIYPCTLRGIPYMISIGNHEYFEGPGGLEDSGKSFLKYMNLPGNMFYYSFNYSNAAFVSLFLVDPKNITDEQVSWLNETLYKLNNSSEIDWIFVFSHYPPYSSSELNYNIINKIVPLVKLYKVDLYFAGHYHHYERLIVDGIPYIITGGGGAETDLYLQSSQWTVNKAIDFQYCYLEINGSQLSFKCYNQQNVLLDEFNLQSWRNST